MEARVLRQLMPKNAQDAGTAKELVSLGAGELAPVIPEMLRELKNLDTPVASIYCEFFAQYGEPFLNEVAKLLGRSTMPELKYVLVSKVLPFWSPEAVVQLRGALGMLLTAPDFWGTDLWCIRLLARHSATERGSLEEWLAFKQRRLRILSELASEVAGEMGRSA